MIVDNPAPVTLQIAGVVIDRAGKVGPRVAFNVLSGDPAKQRGAVMDGAVVLLTDMRREVEGNGAWSARYTVMM